MIKTNTLRLSYKDKSVINDLVEHTTLKTSEIVNYMGELFKEKLTTHHFMYLGFRMGYKTSQLEVINNFVNIQTRKN